MNIRAWAAEMLEEFASQAPGAILFQDMMRPPKMKVSRYSGYPARTWDWVWIQQDLNCAESLNVQIFVLDFYSCPLSGSTNQ